MKVHSLTRRNFLGGTTGGFFALASRLQVQRLLAAEATKEAPAKRVLVLWMNGGPSQFETFDPKPGVETGGAVETISTSVPELSISNFLPEIASRMEHLSVVRNLASTEGEHERAQYYMRTGYPFVDAFPRPSLGSMVSHGAPDSDVPNFVTLGGRGFGPAFLGAEHAPFSVQDPNEALELLNLLSRRRRRIRLAQELGSEFDQQHRGNALVQRKSMISRVERLMDTPFVEALELGNETEQTRDRYGEEFGRRCLAARRLLEAGVRFVEVVHDGWDTHANNHNSVRELCSAIDSPWANLMDDLKASGMLDETIVLWMGEFGRTPNINAQAGRDHFPQVCPVVIGGGGLNSGRIVGATNRNGTAIEGDSYGVADLFATILTQLGIDPHLEYTTSFGSPTPATDEGQVIADLIG